MAHATADRLVEEPAPAKINLDLLVIARRADGYHELDSLVVFTDLGDRLVLGDHPTLGLSIEGPFAGDLADNDGNLVRRAATALAARIGRPPRASIVLDKRLPVASGLGGGSADAAATLRGLCRMWGVELPEAELLGVAGGLGSDVPVCLRCRPSRMRGRGERLDPAEGLPTLPLVLVNPRRAVRTPAVFARLAGSGFGRPRSGAWPSDGDVVAFTSWLATSRNDLEAPAIGIEPAIGGTLAALRAEPDCLLARMAGSGASCFGIFPTTAQAEGAAARIAGRASGWWVRTVTTS